MSNEMEKLTINLGVVELAQIDVLVEQGIYSNRTDLIRTAVRKQLELHEERIKQVVSGAGSKKGIWTIGISYISKAILEEVFEDNGGEKITINVIGMLKISDDVSTELFTKTVSRTTIRGKLLAPPEVKRILKEMD